MTETRPPTPLETLPVGHRKGRVLVVDDHRNMVRSFAISLRGAGFVVSEAVGGTEALRLIDGSHDVVVTDLRMDDVDGMQVLRAALESSSSTQVILMTAFGSVESAVAAMKAGAADYVTKPFDTEELILKVARAAEKRRLLTQVKLMSGQFLQSHGTEQIIGRSRVMRELMERIVRVAQTDATVLVSGESGTGKELVARAIHAHSRRAEQPFVPVNCAAIPDTLLESELFGHARGAYTGAVRARRGLLEQASGGTFFFDEVGETSLAFQAKLLRALQEGEVRRIGENGAISIDLRIVSATNVDLKQAIAERRFREDLYYRLNVVPIRVPPLRERPEDIPLLAEHFLARFDERNETRHRFTPELLDRLSQQRFPGNVRELENLVEQAAALAQSDLIGIAEVGQDPPVATGAVAAPESLEWAVASAERHAIEAALDRSGGDLQEAAARLAVSTTTLWRKMKRLGVSRETPR
jgi:two-component system response regulator HydG